MATVRKRHRFDRPGFFRRQPPVNPMATVPQQTTKNDSETRETNEQVNDRR